MTRPLHKLDPTLFKRAQALLDDEWLAHDADRAPILPTVLARNMGQDWHKAGTFRHNPWVGEPQMVLAQLYLSAGRSDDAVRAAESALQLFSAWGNSWDKRVAWDAWIAWTRILLQSAQKGTWPERLDKLNNLALKPEA